MKIKTNVLSNGLLEFFVAKALGWEDIIMHDGRCYQFTTVHVDEEAGIKIPATKMKRVNILNDAELFLSVLKYLRPSLEQVGNNLWCCSMFVKEKNIPDDFVLVYGNCPEEVIYKAFCLSKFGEEVEYK